MRKDSLPTGEEKFDLQEVRPVLMGSEVSIKILNFKDTRQNNSEHAMGTFRYKISSQLLDKLKRNIYGADVGPTAA